MGQKDNSEMRANLYPFFFGRQDFYSQEVANPMASLFLNSQAGMRGHWTPGPTQAVSGGMELVNEAVPTQNLTFQNAPYVTPWQNVRMYVYFNGSTQCLYSADSYHWTITGTETSVVSTMKGLTLGAWAYFDTTASDHEYIISKRLGSTQCSYSLRRDPNGYALFDVSGTGTSMIEVTSNPDVLAQQTWYWITGCYDPSTSLTLRVNETEYTNTTSIPSSIYSGSAEFVVGARDNGALGYTYFLDGALSQIFVSSAQIYNGRAHYWIWELTKRNHGY